MSSWSKTSTSSVCRPSGLSKLCFSPPTHTGSAPPSSTVVVRFDSSAMLRRQYTSFLPWNPSLLTRSRHAWTVTVSLRGWDCPREVVAILLVLLG